jgi:flagellar basal body-associated protein FliL
VADTNSKTQTENTKTENSKSEAKSAGSKIVPILIIMIVMMLCLVGGYMIGRLLLVGPASAHAASAAETTPAKEVSAEKLPEKGKEKPKEKSLSKEQAKTVSDGTALWSFELDPVIANLDEPGVTRYVRATLILEMNPALDQARGMAMLEEKKALLRDWLTIYLAGCTLEETRGSKNLVRLKAEIRDAYNDYLFKNSKPMVQSILLKEFAIQ